MDAPFPVEMDESTRARRLALIQQFAQAATPEEARRSWDQAQAALPVAERDAARRRLSAIFAALPPDDLEADPAYARYDELWLRVLTGTLLPGNPEYDEFIALADQWGDDYEDLQQAMIPRRGQDLAPQAVPDYDFSFLRDANPPQPRTSLSERAIAVWKAGLSYELKTAPERLFTQVQVAFSSLLQPAPLAGQLRAGDAQGDKRDLFVSSIGPAPDRGLPGRYQVRIEASRANEHATTCRLIVHVSGTGLRQRTNEIAVIIGYSSGPERRANPNEQGVATFEDVPIEDLGSLTVSIDLPMPPTQ